MDPVRGHALLSSGPGRFPRGELPGSFRLPGQAVPPWGKRGPQKVHTALRQPAQALNLVSSPVLQSYGALPCQGSLDREKGKFKSKLLSLDSSTITLCLSLFPWPSISWSREGSRRTSFWTTTTTCPTLSCLSRPR
ncbi:hypothetical protein DFAR_550007 [Desulfarculales bacterium]